MNREDAIRYVEQQFGFIIGSSDFYANYTALVKIRHDNVFLPDVGIDGSIRDESEWALIDMAYKIDTGVYGAVYYFGNKD